jgi:hypothetical protein
VNAYFWRINLRQSGKLSNADERDIGRASAGLDLAIDVLLLGCVRSLVRIQSSRPFLSNETTAASFGSRFYCGRFCLQAGQQYRPALNDVVKTFILMSYEHRVVSHSLGEISKNWNQYATNEFLKEKSLSRSDSTVQRSDLKS